MRKYLKYKCSVCARTQDRLVDTKVADILKCSITMGCSGKLFPVQYSERGDVIPDAAPAGAENWYSRFETITEYKNNQPSNVQLSYGPSAELILAVLVPTQIASTQHVDVVFEISKSENRSFREYLFNTTTKTDRILGVESGIGRKVLRFVSVGTSTEQIQVIVNGVELSEGTGETQYSISRSTNTLPSNVIVFNKPLLGTNQIRVVVSKIDPPELSTLRFSKVNAQTNIVSSWANVSAVMSGGTYQLFSFNFIEDQTPIGKNLKIVRAQSEVNGSSANIKLSDCMFLLSNGPTFIDRCLTVVARLDTLSSSALHIVSSESGKEIECTEDLLASLQTPLVPTLFVSDSLIKTSLASSNTSHVSDFITGPDV